MLHSCAGCASRAPGTHGSPTPNWLRAVAESNSNAVATTILVIDDSLVTRKHLERVLSSSRVADHVLLANDGADALQLLTSHDVSLILCDLEMPELGGMKLLRIVQGMPEFARIPLLLTTVHTEVRYKVQGLTEGAVDYVTKPFVNEELIARVRVQLRIKALQDELRAKNERLEELSRVDYLTQLSNRRHLMEVLSGEFARAKRHGCALSFVLADLDHFKRTNDQFGHPVGDRCLQLVSSTMVSQLRKSDHAARFGGEEFALVLPETDSAGAAVVAERFRAAVASSSLLVEGKKVPMTISVGVATFPGRDITSVEGLIKAADKALYAAKDAGRNRVVA